MVLPPDHADRVIAQHRSRVEKVSMMGTLVLISSAGWWLLPAMDGSVELLPRMGPVIAIFISSLMLMDLIDYGPIERSRIAIICGLSWPMVMAMAIDSFGQGDRAIATAILVLVATNLFLYWRNSLSSTLSTKRLRAFSGLAGSAIGIAIVISLDLELLIAGVFAFCTVGIVIPDILAKDDEHQERKLFSIKLDAAEAKMLGITLNKFRSRTGLVSHSASSGSGLERSSSWNGANRGGRKGSRANY